jgi:hypothetical protein
VTAVAAAELGPAGAVLAGLLGPYAALAGKRLRGLIGTVEEAGFDRERIVESLEGNEALAQMIAEVVRGTVESDLEAKRRLLARAAIRALEDDAVVDEVTIYVRTANAVDAIDLKVLSRLGQPRSRGKGPVTGGYVRHMWPDIAEIFGPAISSLESAGLVVTMPETETDADTGDEIELTWEVTPWGRRFLDRLREEGLEAEVEE